MNSTKTKELNKKIQELLQLQEQRQKEVRMKEPKMEEINEVPIQSNFSEHKVQIDARLNDTLKVQVISFLKNNHDCFAWV